MTSSYAIRQFEAHEAALYRTLRLRALADAPDAYGSTLEAEQARTPEMWAARLAAALASGQDYPLVAEQAGKAVGLLWAKMDATDAALVQLFQMWVEPSSRGRGIAAGLIREAIHWTKTENRSRIRLGVTCGDSPAMRLYLRAGFLACGQAEPLRAGSPLLAQTMELAIGGR